MQLIAHRGYWLDPKEKNTEIAFLRALTHGYGIETDFRDCNGGLVISHDIPLIGAMSANELISLYQSHPVKAPLALNIKADGLQHLVHQFVSEATFRNYFVFDMAVPDMRGYIHLGLSTYSRQSEYEPIPALLSSCQGVWLDAFQSTWYEIDTINAIVAQGKGVAIVSPELHGRPHLPLWQYLKDHGVYKHGLVSLCTDFPRQAQEFFNVQN